MSLILTKNNILKKIGCSYFVISFILSLAVTLLPWWPTNEILTIPKYALLFGPRWWLLIIVVGLFTFWRYLKQWQLKTYPILILLSFNYLDFQLPVTGSLFSPPVSPVSYTHLTLPTSDLV